MRLDRGEDAAQRFAGAYRVAGAFEVGGACQQIGATLFHAVGGEQRREDAVVAVLVVGRQRVDPVEHGQQASEPQHRRLAIGRCHFECAVIDFLDLDADDTGQITRRHQREHRQVAESVCDVEEEVLVALDDAGQSLQDLGLFAGIAGVGDQQAIDVHAELLGEFSARQLQQGVVDLPGLDGGHQLQHGVVVGAFALEEHVPHAAGGAD
jgi:hypothetical protein